MDYSKYTAGQVHYTKSAVKWLKHKPQHSPLSNPKNNLIQGFFGLFHSRYFVVFPVENSNFFSQFTGKNSKLNVTKLKKMNKNR